MDTKNLAILFSDMVGYTKFSATSTRQQILALLEVQDKIFLPTVSKYKGKVVKTIGDAYLVTFESSTNALLCALKIQDLISSYNTYSSKDNKFQVRIALNCGDVTIKNNDVFGTPVNIAARVQTLAKPGEIYLTEAIYLTANKSEIPFAKLGKKSLKGVPENVKIYRVGFEEKYSLKKQIALSSIMLFLLITILTVNHLNSNSTKSITFGIPEILARDK